MEAGLSLFVPPVSISGLLNIFVVRNLSPVPNFLLLAVSPTRATPAKFKKKSSSIFLSTLNFLVSLVPRCDCWGNLRVALERGGGRSGSGQREIIVPRWSVALSVSPLINLPSKSGRVGPS